MWKIVLLVVFVTSISGELLRIPLHVHEAINWPAHKLQKDESLESEEIDFDFSQRLYGNIQLGEPAQDLKIVFSTGYSSMWVLKNGTCPSSTECLTGFQPSRAKIFTNEYGSIEVSDEADYSSYTNLLFTKEAEATLTIAGITIPEKQFSLAYFVQHNYLPIHGVLGLGIDNESSPFFEIIKYSGAQNAIFSIYMDFDGERLLGSELIIGGSDPNLYTDELSYLPLKSSTQWMIEFSSIQISNYSLCSSCDVILDSGKSIMIAPQAAFNYVVKLLGATNDGRNPYKIDCNVTIPDLEISFGSITMFVPGSILLYKQPNGICLLAMNTKGDDSWYLGDRFLRYWYTEFDYTNKRIGFGYPKSPAPSSSPAPKKSLKCRSLN